MLKEIECIRLSHLSFGYPSDEVYIFGTMSLLRLVHRPELNAWARQKAESILESIPSKDLILEAYLFGSAAYGNFTMESDLDFVIVTESPEASKKIQSEVYAIGFTDIAVDWIFKTKIEFDERKTLGGVCFVAFHDGLRLR